MKVNWDDYSQYFWENKIHGNQTTNQCIQLYINQLMNIPLIRSWLDHVYRLWDWKRCPHSVRFFEPPSFPAVQTMDNHLVKFGLWNHMKPLGVYPDFLAGWLTHFESILSGKNGKNHSQTSLMCQGAHYGRQYIAQIQCHPQQDPWQPSSWHLLGNGNRSPQTAADLINWWRVQPWKMVPDVIGFSQNKSLRRGLDLAQNMLKSK